MYLFWIRIRVCFGFGPNLIIYKQVMDIYLSDTKILDLKCLLIKCSIRIRIRLGLKLLSNLNQNLDLNTFKVQF